MVLKLRNQNITIEKELQAFYEHRKLLIEKLERGELTKRSYLELCHDYFTVNEIHPFVPVPHTFYEGLLNYQYHNTMAKYYQMLADESYTASSKTLRGLDRKIDEHYRQKDKATLFMLEVVNYENVEAYYLTLRSSRLTGKLIEIVFKDRAYTILHSMDVRILRKLSDHNCFQSEERTSAIDHYVNTKY